MRSCTCVLVVVCIVRKLPLCPSYSRCRDRINLALWRSLYKGGGYRCCACTATVLKCYGLVAQSPPQGGGAGV